MEWDVQYDETFVAELAEIERQTGSSAVCEEVAALALLLRRFGPQLKRPHCDTLKGSKHTNMKELRFTLPDGEWRVAFVLIRDVRLSCSWRATNWARMSGGSTAS